MTRREIRNCAFILIYEKLLRDDPIEELYETADEIEEITVNDSVKILVESVLEKAEELDGKISNYSTTRSITRIPKINLAFYEILYDDLTPVNVAINEAVLLSQAYSYKEDTAFINGVLSSFAKSLSQETPANV